MKYYDKTQFGRDRTPGDPQRFHNVNSLICRCGAADGMSLNRDSNASKRATTIRIGRWSLAAPLVDIAFGDSSLRSSGDTAAETLPTR